MTGARAWADITTVDFEAVDPAATIALLPTAAVEQHGPHLPVGTDMMIAEGMLARLAEAAPASLDLRILPILAVGKSNEHLHAPGTLTLSATTALAVWREVGLSVARAGIRKLVIANSHGGNWALLQVLIRELRLEAGLLAVACQWSGFGTPAGMYSEDELAFGIHGGDVETSLMLAFRPETVRMAHAAHNRSSAETSVLQPIGAQPYGWVAPDLHPSGTVGDAAAATAEKGHATAEHQVKGMLGLLDRVRAMPLAGFAPVQPSV